MDNKPFCDNYRRGHLVVPVDSGLVVAASRSVARGSTYACGWWLGHAHAQQKHRNMNNQHEISGYVPAGLESVGFSIHVCTQKTQFEDDHYDFQY